jgi:hypothetical protein
LEEVLSQPVPRPLDPKLHLARTRRDVLGSCVIAGVLALLTLVGLGASGLAVGDLELSSALFLVFYGGVLCAVPVWQVVNHRRARRLLTYGNVVSASFSLGSPTRGHPAPPIRATFTANGRQRSVDFVNAGLPHPLPERAALLVLTSDVGLYVPGVGLVAARVR